mmetsp:Transcript_61711/g.139248  ORF Transcript_61711/g.139248 Transcript_61711/m.139248 type:complete len:234 (-) Transcript_61711:289-990(-)
MHDDRACHRRDPTIEGHQLGVGQHGFHEVAEQLGKIFPKSVHADDAPDAHGKAQQYEGIAHAWEGLRDPQDNELEALDPSEQAEHPEGTKEPQDVESRLIGDHRHPRDDHNDKVEQVPEITPERPQEVRVEVDRKLHREQYVEEPFEDFEHMYRVWVVGANLDLHSRDEKVDEDDHRHRDLHCGGFLKPAHQVLARQKIRWQPRLGPSAWELVLHLLLRGATGALLGSASSIR